MTDSLNSASTHAGVGKCKALVTYVTEPGIYSTHLCELPDGHKGAHSDALATWTGRPE